MGQRAGPLPEWVWISVQGRCTQLFLTNENAGTLLRLRQTCAIVTGKSWIYSHRDCRLATRGRILEGVDGSPFMGRLGPQALWRTTEQRTMTSDLRILTGDTITASLPLVGGCSHRHQTPVTRYVAKEQWSKAIARLKERLRAVKPGFVPRSYGREAGYSYFKRLCAAVAEARPASRRHEKIDGPGPDKDGMPWKDDVPTIGVLAAMVEEEDTMVVLSTAADMGGDMRELMEGKMPEGVKGHLVSPCLEADQYVGAVAGGDGALEPDDLVPPKAFWDQMPKIEGVHAAFRARVMGKSTRVGMDTAAQFCLVKQSALSNSSYANRRRTRVRLLGVGGDLKISEIAAVRVQLGSDKNARGIWVWALIVPEVAIPFPDIDMVLDFTTLTVVADRIETPEPGDYSIQIRADDVVQHMIELAAKPEIKTATSTRVCRPFHLGPDLQGVRGRGHIPAAAIGAAGEGSSL